MRPQLEAQQARLAEIARGMGPTAEAAFALNPDQFGKSLAEQFSPQVVASGGVQSIAGTGQRIGAPVLREFGDTIQQYDPTTGALSQLAQRGPTIAEQTAQDRLAFDQRNAGDRLALDRQIREDNTDIARGNLDVNRGRLALAEDEAGQKQAQQAEAASRVREVRLQTAQNMRQALSGASDLVSSAGRISAMNPLSGQSRANLQSYLDTLKANLTFDKLNEMKAASAGGSSGLGALSDNEANLLGSAVASLSIDQSPKQLRDALSNIERLVGRMERDGATNGQPVRVNSVAEARSLPSGTVFIDPNGVRRRVP